MATHIVLKDGDQLTVYNHDDYREVTLLCDPRNLKPGEDFIVVHDTSREEDALKQARAYFDRTHQEPEVIDTWAALAKVRQQKLKGSQQ